MVGKLSSKNVVLDHGIIPLHLSSMQSLGSRLTNFGLILPPASPWVFILCPGILTYTTFGQVQTHKQLTGDSKLTAS